jgi:hypothetical protein
MPIGVRRGDGLGDVRSVCSERHLECWRPGPGGRSRTPRGRRVLTKGTNCTAPRPRPPALSRYGEHRPGVFGGSRFIDVEDGEL